MNKAQRNAQQLAMQHPGDARSGRVVFLSHCILNENTRYPGGACRECCVHEIIEQCMAMGIGIVQMPCPEQHAWGGVTKRLLLVAYAPRGWRRALLQVLSGLLLTLALAYTRLVYRRMARQITRQVRDYEKSGFEVVGVVGIDGSPSCGVNKTLDLHRAFRQMANATAPGSRVAATLPAALNDIVRRSLIEGSGLFTLELQRALARSGVKAPLLAHDLIGGLDGRPSGVSLS